MKTSQTPICALIVVIFSSLFPGAHHFLKNRTEWCGRAIATNVVCSKIEKHVMGEPCHCCFLSTVKMSGEDLRAIPP